MRWGRGGARGRIVPFPTQYVPDIETRLSSKIERPLKGNIRTRISFILNAATTMGGGCVRFVCFAGRQTNSQFFSALAPARATTYPDITIQMPVFKEGLEKVILPTIISLEVSKRRDMGGEAFLKSRNARDNAWACVCAPL